MEIYTKIYKRKDLVWSRRNRGDFAPRMGWCEIGRCCANFAQPEGVVRISHKLGAVVFQKPYLPHFSSKSYTVWSVVFLTSWALKWYIECRKWTSESAPKVWKKTAAAVLCYLYSVFLFFSSLLLSFTWLDLMIQKAVKTLRWCLFFYLILNRTLILNSIKY